MTTIDWMRSADPSMDYLVDRDLFDTHNEIKYRKIGKEGWCYEYIKNRKPDGTWGNRFYQPKWICTHYTILELRNLEYPPTDSLLQKEINRIGFEEIASDGGINPSVTMDVSDTCVTAMYLNYAAYYGADTIIIKRIIDFLLSQQMSDGGYNCDFNQKAVFHSSFHTSICVLEAFHTYEKCKKRYRIDEVRNSKERIVEFLLEHKFYRSSRTNEIVDKKMLLMTYPFRWKYTVLRALNAFVDCNVMYDSRMDEALNYIECKGGTDSKWKIQSGYAGKEYFKMEEAGKPSKIISYLAIKILRKYGKIDLTIAST